MLDDTELDMLAWEKKKDIVNALKMKNTIDRQDKSGQTALHKAVLKGDEEMVKLLLDAKCDSTIQDDFGATALYAALVMGSDDETLKMLIDAASSAGEIDDMFHTDYESGQTPLHLAVESGDIEAIRMLLDAGAGFDAFGNWSRNEDGETALFIAARDRNKEAAEMLLAADEDMTLDLAISKIKSTNSNTKKEAYMYLIQLIIDKIQITNAEEAMNVGKNILIKIAELSFLKGFEEIIENLLIKGARLPLRKQEPEKYLLDIDVTPEILAEIAQKIKNVVYKLNINIVNNVKFQDLSPVNSAKSRRRYSL